MDFELTESQQNEFEKIQAGDHYTDEDYDPEFDAASYT